MKGVLVDLDRERALREGSPQVYVEVAAYQHADGPVVWTSEVRMWRREGETRGQLRARLEGLLVAELRRLADAYDPRPSPTRRRGRVKKSK